MRNIKNLLVAFVLVAVTLTGFNSVASASSQPIAPSQLKAISCRKNLVSFSWWVPSVAKVDYFTLAVNGNRVVKTTARTAAIKYPDNTKSYQISVRNWVNGVSSNPDTITYSPPITCQ